MRLTVLPILLVAWLLAGCSTAGQEGAATGAKAGAVGGLVAGAVGSIFWGGDAVNNALRSAAVGAASGAAVGAVAAEDRSKKSGQGGAPAPPAPAGGSAKDAEALKAWVGPGNYAAGEELARCRHMGAISKAEQAFKREADPERKGIALLIQAMAAEESGNTAKADEIYRHWAAFDPARSNRDKARSDALAGILKIQQIRKDSGLPVLCT